MQRKINCTVIIVLLIAWLAAQLVMPRSGKSFVMTEYNCYSGDFSLVDSQNSTCVSPPAKPLGFPLIINEKETRVTHRVVSVVADVAPLVVLGFLLLRVCKRSTPKR